MKKIILFLLFTVHCSLFTVSAQSKKMDSLKVELNKAKCDTTRLRIYFALCDACDIKDNLKYSEPLIKLLEKLSAEAPNDKKKKYYLEKKADAYSFVRDFYTDKKDTTKTIEVQQIRIRIYKEAKDTEAIIGQMRGLSNYYMSIENYPKGIEYCQKAISVAKEMKYKKGVAGCLQQIAQIYASQGEIIQALENYQQSLLMYSELKDTIRMADLVLSEGFLYCKFHNYNKALECYNKSISLSEIKKNKRGVRKGYDCIAGMYGENNDFPNALVYLQKCLSMSEEMKDNYLIGLSLKSIGNIHSQQGYFDKALTEITGALKIFKNLKDETQTGWSYYGLADTYFKQKNYTKATLYIDSALVIEKHQAFIDNLKGGELLATKIDSASGNGSGAYEHYKQYIVLSNKLKSEEVHQLAQKEKYQKEYDKQKAADQAEQDKKDAATKQEKEKDAIVRNSFIGGFALMMLLAGVSYRNFRRKKKDNLIISKQKQIVEQKNQEILDSIEYALRIQTAILPPQRIVKQYLENSFILYKPKDIVAGDFYWMETIQFGNESMKQFDNEKNNQPKSSHFQIDKLNNCQILFAACDCTGHGVPGAMVSVVCHNALNRAVREFGLTKPSEILDKTAEIVIENFAKSEEDIKDGMDISMVSLKYNAQSKKTELEYAGANNPLWIVRGTPLSLVEGLGVRLEETRADKQPIGMNEDNHPFTNHTFELNSGDTFYLFTDGFADQFGGDTGDKKLTRKKFKELILSIQHLSMTEQGVSLDKFITDYRKEVEQIDDILVMGVRI